MNDLVISIITTSIGIIITFIVSRYFYKRSFTKSLSTYIQFFSSPLKGIDPNVQKDLKIEYQNKIIDNLYEIQFLIANTGDKAIHDLIEPLTLVVPKNCNILDTSILYVSPEGRNVEVKPLNANNEIEYVFPLLNSGDFFITKILLNGEPNFKEFIFKIVSDELPPVLKVQHLPTESISTNKKNKFEYGILIAGIVFLIIGLSNIILIYNSWHTLPCIKNVGIFNFLAHLGFNGWAIFISCIPAFLISLIGIMMSLASFTDGTFPPKRKRFIVPENKQLLKRFRPRMLFENYEDK